MDVTYAFPIRGNRRANRYSRAQLESLVRAGSTPRHWSSMPADSSCRQQGPSTNLQIAASSTVIATPSQGGGAATSQADWLASQRRAVGTTATIFPLGEARSDQFGEQHNRTARLSSTRSSLDDLAATLINRNAHDLAMSRSTIWRILDEADLKPHRSVYSLNSHDPDFDAKAQEICKLYIKAPMMYRQGRLVICCDEKTGMQALGRPHPTQPAVPGKPERREQDYIRYGTRSLIASLIVPTGEPVGDWDRPGPVWTLRHTWITWPGSSLKSRALTGCWITSIPTGAWKSAVSSLNCATSLRKQRCSRQANNGETSLTDPTHKHVFHFTPIHGSWLNQVELWFSVFGRRFLKRGDFASMADFKARLLKYVEDYNPRHAHPYRWTYTGTPLVRGTPFSQTRRQQRQGRTWFSPRPQQFERLLYPPRPYKRQTKKTG